MKRGLIALACAGLAAVALALVGPGRGADRGAAAEASPAPVLSVALAWPQRSMLPLRVPATGHVAAWREASVGAEADGLRLTEVRVNVGDTVRRGQVLAVFHADIVAAEHAEAAAAVAQAMAEADEADVNARRAKNLGTAGALSAQQVGQYTVGAATARARLAAARAVENRHRLRLTQTRVLAPSDGVITARMATVGAVVAAGEELFRLIEDGRLEWRAAVSATDLDQLRPGQAVTIGVQGGVSIQGTVRMLGPVIDTQTHSGLAYVDLPRGSAVRAGAFVSGYIEVGERPALVLPQSAVLLRDGFHTVMRVDAASAVVARKVGVGRRIDDWIEITDGLALAEPVIASGLGFLSEGDAVRVVGGPGRDGADAPPPGAPGPNGAVRTGGAP